MLWETTEAKEGYNPIFLFHKGCCAVFVLEMDKTGKGVNSLEVLNSEPTERLGGSRDGIGDYKIYFEVKSTRLNEGLDIEG